ncbi:Pre-mRNA-splicing factor cef1 [Coemansia sp. Benny D115]|nr:Pre-mRNA-splicing factor cef1 [Coemansia sp. Benny D115]
MKIHLKGGVWKNTEDEILKAAVMKYGKTQWARISSLLVRKTPKQCKARWYEWLDPSIKKTEWSKEEDEKLLHLAKLMPTQWRTIAPIVGRAPAQCLERYQKLLDEAEARAAGEEDLGLRGEVGAEGRASEARRLRPGEIDPNPESKAARPDPVDMDEDEKDMLSEARARLANTMGKKAKRKARERQLEEARRLASLQKRRELKAAGIELKTKKKTKLSSKSTMDYNIEIPFERKPVPGFYDTTEELARQKPVDNLKGRFLDSLEGKSRSAREDEARQEAKRKRENKGPVRFVQASGATDQEARRAEEADQISKRSRLVLPAPQVTDTDLETIAKMSSQGVLARELVGGGAAEGLLDDYSATLAVASTATRTPAQTDRIMEEALAQRQMAMQATPLLGTKGEGLVLPTPVKTTTTSTTSASMATPNPLASQLLSTPQPGGSTSRVRDSLGLNTPAPPSIAEATPKEIKTAGRGLREQLARKLAALPKPKNDFEIVVPEPVPAAEPAATDVFEDQEDVERRMEQLRLEELEKQKSRRSQCVQRGLPRPDMISKDILGKDPVLRLIGQEMCSLILHDAKKFPVSDRPILYAPEGMHVEPLEHMDDDLLAQARELIANETQPEPPVEEGAWVEAEGASVWLGSSSGHVQADSVSAEELVQMYREQLEARRLLMAEEAARAAKMEGKLAVTLGGYQKRSDMLSEQIDKAFREYEQAKMDTDAFANLHAQEQAIIPARIEKARDELAAVEQRESVLQAEYQQLIERRNVLSN